LEQHLFFVNLLYRANQAKKLQSRGKAALKPVFESFIAPLKEAFPSPCIKWNYQRISSRYEWVRDNYRVYRDALKMTGKQEDAPNGKIYISRRQEADLKQSHPKAAARVLKDGLGVGGHITVEIYNQIFSNDLHASDDDTFAGQERIPSSNESLPNRPQKDNNSIMVDFHTTLTLVAMPTEVLCMIGSNLGHQELRVVTLVSKRLRELFLPRLFTRVKFSGNLEELGKKLTSFIDGISAPLGQTIQLTAK
jgi:hypothetical protein